MTTPKISSCGRPESQTPKDDLVKMVKSGVDFVYAKLNDPDVNGSEYYAFDNLLKVLTALSPRPLEDGELAHYETAIELLNRLYNFFEISNATDILGIYTALHDALARIERLIEKIETYGFECEGGPLTNCVQWIQLKEIVNVKNK